MTKYRTKADVLKVFRYEVLPYEERRIKRNMQIDHTLDHDAFELFCKPLIKLHAYSHFAKRKWEKTGGKYYHLFEPDGEGILFSKVIPVGYKLKVFSYSERRYVDVRYEGKVPATITLPANRSEWDSYAKFYDIRIYNENKHVDRRNLSVAVIYEKYSELDIYHMQFAEEVFLKDYLQDGKPIRYCTVITYASPHFQELYESMPDVRNGMLSFNLYYEPDTDEFYIEDYSKYMQDPEFRLRKIYSMSLSLFN